jgi:hypothetical protein
MQLLGGHCWGCALFTVKTTNKHPDASGPQTVDAFIRLHNGDQTINLGFTDQKISPHAGLASFAAFLHWHHFKEILETALPIRTSHSG